MCNSPAFPCGDGRTTAVPWYLTRQRSFSATLCYIPFCLVMLLGSPAISQTATDDRFAPQDAEIRILPKHVEGRPSGEQPRIVEPSATELSQALERERSRVGALLRDLAAARMELDAARQEGRAARQAAQNDALRYKQGVAAERQLSATLTQELSAAWADLKAMSVQFEQAANAAVQAREAAEAAVNEAGEIAARERAKSAALEQKLLAVRKDLDAIKNSAQMAGSEREEILLRDLAAARRDLDAMRRAADDAGAQARRIAETTAERERALQEQRQRAEGLARDLTVVLREMEDLRAKAAGAMRSKAAALRARHAAEVSLADAFDEERRKLGAYKRDLAAARQLTAAAEARAKLAAAELAAAVQARKVAEAAAMRAGAALALELEKGRSLARDFDTARRERDLAKEELTRVLAARRAALEDESDRANGRDPAAARKKKQSLKARTERRMEDEADVPKARADNRARERSKAAVRTGARSVGYSGSREIGRVKARKPTPAVRSVTIVLPDALLPRWSRAPNRW
ncbi:hypothetical protein I6F15_14420 [Bradyrhizobium sp. BRP14]|nr:hypothetical protein [Bradyrhizobium sp. BRP14]